MSRDLKTVVFFHRHSERGSAYIRNVLREQPITAQSDITAQPVMAKCIPWLLIKHSADVGGAWSPAGP